MGKDELPVLDRTAFDDFAALFDADELREVVEQWHADSIRALEAIGAARSSGDRARVGEIAHRAAGGALSIGAMVLARASEALRSAAESGQAVGDPEIAAVRNAVAATYAALRAAAAGGA